MKHRHVPVDVDDLDPCGDRHGEGSPPARAVAYFRAVAVDFDGTLTVDSRRPDPAVLAAMTRARDRGVRIVVVTGRILSELDALFPDVDRFVDAIVGENGGVVRIRGAERRLAAPVDDRLVAALVAQGVVFRRGHVLLACHAGDEAVVTAEIRRLGLECQLVRNRSELMVLPAGISKGTGLYVVLGDLRLSHHNTIGVGDAENDHSLLETCEIGAVVANAVPSLREHADVVLDLPDGQGVASLLDGDLLAGRRVVHPKRWQLVLGHDDDGRAVELPASQINILVIGGTGDGKSYLAGLLAEQLVALDYSLVITDPEGDHVGLGLARGVLVVSGANPLPPPDAVVRLVRHRYATVVLDLSGLPPDEQIAYVRGIPAEIEAQRAATGLPQWVFVDEAHTTVGPRGVAQAAYRPCSKGNCLVTWRPQDLSPEAIASVDAVIALAGTDPDDAIVDVTAAVGEVPRSEVATLLTTDRTGRAVLTQRARPRQVVAFTIASRVTPHLRHAHKYDLFALEYGRRFFFRYDTDTLSGATAGNLPELEREISRCERATLCHHCPRHDFSRWIAEVLRDRVLAATIEDVEREVHPSSPTAVVEAARRQMLKVLHTRRVVDVTD